VPLPRDTIISRPAIDARRRRAELARRTLASRGLVEAVAFSFISSRSAELFGGAKPELRLVNPISADLDAMRPSALPGLVEAARRNADRGFPDVALFELGPAVLGHFGELHPDVLDAFEVKGPVAAFEVFLDAAPLPRAGRARQPLKLSVFQPVERDFAFIVDRDLPAETLLRAARGVDRKLVSEIRLFDVYEGKGLPDGKKSLAISVVLQPQEATLTDSEIDAFSKRLVAAVEKATGGTLRS